MNRRHLFEVEDQTWIPQSLREVITQSLQMMVNHFGVYDVGAPLIRRAIQRSDHRRIVDLCSGSGGPWPRLYPSLNDGEEAVELVLTDRYPQGDDLTWLDGLDGARYWPGSVDARAVPGELSGVRTLFTGFHHFAPGDATGILADAVAQRAPIAVFESTVRRPSNVALAATLGPLGLAAGVPWLRPFRWTHLLWTYVLPLAPLAYAWDGAVSNLRTYTPDELLEMAAAANDGSFTFEAGALDVEKAPAPVTYLLGLPRA